MKLAIDIIGGIGFIIAFIVLLINGILHTSGVDYTGLNNIAIIGFLIFAISVFIDKIRRKKDVKLNIYCKYCGKNISETNMPHDECNHAFVGKENISNENK